MSSSAWKAVVDEKTSRTYYYNKETKVTQWTKPDDFEAPQPQAAASVPEAIEDPNNNAANWRSLKDEKSGKTYYYNKVSKKTAWQKPECMGPAEESVPSEGDVANAWNVAVDQNSGKKYWFNKVTKVTQWTEPNGWVEPAAAQPDASTEASASAAPKKNALKALADDSDPEDDGGVQTGNADHDVEKKMALQEKDEKEIADEGEEKADPEDGQSMKSMLRDDGEGSDEEGGGEYRMAKHRKGFFNRLFHFGEQLDDEKLLSFKKSLIKKALLKQNRNLDAEAIQSFKNIMSFMGDRSSSKGPLDHAKKILRNLMLAPASLRDEAYMQLCKQTTENPSATSCQKGWELMSLFLASFPPSKNFKHFLQDHLKKNVQPQYKECKELVDMCTSQMDKIVTMGQRKQVMSTVEIQCLMEMKTVSVSVSLLNGMEYKFDVDSYSMISDLQNMIAKKLNIIFTAPFAIFEAGALNVERAIDPKERVVDMIASWENVPLEVDIHSEKVDKWAFDYNHFVYKAKLVLKTTTPEVMNDPESINLLYVQAVCDVTSNRYPIKDKDIPVLAALQLQAQFSDFKPSTHIAGWLAPRIQDYMPIVLCMGKQGKDQKLVKEWEQKILTKYPKVAGFKVEEAKINYLEFMQDWTFYGATFFSVEQRQFKDYPSPLMLGVTCEGVLLMHPEKRIVLENYPLADVLTWGHSDEKFVIVVGNLVSQRKLIFKTMQGKNMNILIREYVKYKLKSKAGAAAAVAVDVQV